MIRNVLVIRVSICSIFLMSSLTSFNKKYSRNIFIFWSLPLFWSTFPAPCFLRLPAFGASPAHPEGKLKQLPQAVDWGSVCLSTSLPLLLLLFPLHGGRQRRSGTEQGREVLSWNMEEWEEQKLANPPVEGHFRHREVLGLLCFGESSLHFCLLGKLPPACQIQIL